MPGWMIAVLKWGGLALVLLNGLGLFAFGPGGTDPAAAGQAGGNVGMLLFGLVAAGVGFLADRISRH
jgi:hypothetical protein